MSTPIWKWILFRQFEDENDTITAGKLFKIPSFFQIIPDGASDVKRWEVVGNDKNQCVQMTRNDAEKSKSARRRRETINSYLKLKTYLKYKYLLILKCDFRWLSGDPADENTEKEEGRRSSKISRITTNDLGPWYHPNFAF